MFTTYVAFGFSVWGVIVLLACAFIRGADERREHQPKQ